MSIKEIESETPHVEQVVPPVKDSVSYDSHRKLLGEKKAIQEELKAFRDAEQLREQNKLQSEGKQDDVIKSLREELLNTKNSHKQTTDKVAFDKFESQCVAKAKELGCSDTESLMMYMSKDKMATIQIDDRLNANKDDLERVVNEIKTLKPNLFGASIINHNSVNMTGFKKQEEKTVRTMSRDELKAYARQNL